MLLMVSRMPLLLVWLYGKWDRGTAAGVAEFESPVPVVADVNNERILFYAIAIAAP